MNQRVIFAVTTVQGKRQFSGPDLNEVVERARTFIISTVRNGGGVEIKVEHPDAMTQGRIHERLMKAAEHGAMGLL